MQDTKMRKCLEIDWDRMSIVQIRKVPISGSENRRTSWLECHTNGECTSATCSTWRVWTWSSPRLHYAQSCR